MVQQESQTNVANSFFNPKHPVIFSADSWCIKSLPQHSILVPLPFSEGDWIPRANDLGNLQSLYKQIHEIE